MSTTTTITGLSIQDQAVAFSVTVDGPAGSKGLGLMVIYDAAGTELSRTDLGEMAVGQRWDALLDLPVSTLPDGDYAVWVFMSTTPPDGSIGGADSKGLSFLVGRGRVYPSAEKAPEREFTEPPTISPLRLEGSWIVFDMTNKQAYDVPVTHRMTVTQEGVTGGHDVNGKELLQAGATQQGHYLLPDDMAAGKHLVLVAVQNEGSDVPSLSMASVLVDGHVLTLLPQ